MVRAELGAGNREAALELLERLRERCVVDSFFRTETFDRVFVSVIADNTQRRCITVSVEC